MRWEKEKGGVSSRPSKSTEIVELEQKYLAMGGGSKVPLSQTKKGEPLKNPFPSGGDHFAREVGRTEFLEGEGGKMQCWFFSKSIPQKNKGRVLNRPNQKRERELRGLDLILREGGISRSTREKPVTSLTMMSEEGGGQSTLILGGNILRRRPRTGNDFRGKN